MATVKRLPSARRAAQYAAGVRLQLLVALLAVAAPAAAQPPPIVVVTAGDIACDPADPAYNGGAGTATRCRMAATAALALDLAPDAVLVLGDNQYENGALAKYEASYKPTWGQLLPLTRPVPGNHEYLTPGAAGYYAYFGAAAGDAAEGWYSFDLGAWHLVALNGNCGAVGGCGAGSPQEEWLLADLAASDAACTLAFWHQPRFSSGPHGSDATYQPFWSALWSAGADLVLNGHDHLYERFAPQRPDGTADPAGGLRQLTVGTGGKNLTGVVAVAPNSELRLAESFGVVALALYPNGYEWRFVADGGGWSDAGAGLCHGAFPAPGADFYTLPPCRLVDTRRPVGPTGGPALAAGMVRSFPAAGQCGIPDDAVAVAVNVTVAAPSGGGELRLFPWGGAVPGSSTIAFAAGQSRANNAVPALGVAGKLAVACDLPSSPNGTAHLVVDVSGYFR